MEPTLTVSSDCLLVGIVREFEKELEKYSLETVPSEMLREAKRKGYADRQIAHVLKCLESQVYKKRNELGIKRVFILLRD